MNKVILMGRMVADPETRYTQNNTAMTRFKIAVNRQIK
jgi:single-strand DNA-binding protein